MASVSHPLPPGTYVVDDVLRGQRIVQVKHNDFVKQLVISTSVLDDDALRLINAAYLELVRLSNTTDLLEKE